MAILVTGNTFADGDQVTSTKLNNIANAATFASGAVDGATTTLTAGGAIQVGTIQPGNIASNAVTTAKIADATDTSTGVTDSKLRWSAATSVIGRSAASSGAPADIAASANDQVLRMSSGTIGFGTITPSSLTQWITSGTSQSASSTAVTFTGIPSWAKRVTLILSGVSTNGSSAVLVQLGTSSGFTTTGYATGTIYGGAASLTSTTGFNTYYPGASFIRHGQLVLTNLTGNTWIGSGIVAESSVGTAVQLGGTIALAAAFDRIRVTTVNGTDTFDAGTINIIYE